MSSCKQTQQSDLCFMESGPEVVYDLNLFRGWGLHMSSSRILSASGTSWCWLRHSGWLQTRCIYCWCVHVAALAGRPSDSDPKATECVLWACRFQALPANFFDNELASSAHATRPLDGIGVGNAESKAGDLSLYLQNFGHEGYRSMSPMFLHVCAFWWQRHQEVFRPWLPTCGASGCMIVPLHHESLKSNRGPPVPLNQCW